MSIFLKSLAPDYVKSANNIIFMGFKKWWITTLNFDSSTHNLKLTLYALHWHLEPRYIWVLIYADLLVRDILCHLIKLETRSSDPDSG